MGKLKGFLEYAAVKPDCRPVRERLGDYREYSLPLPSETLIRQAARCMDCGIPFCHALGCPLGNYIPEWNDLVYQGRTAEAYLRLSLTNNFPEITGRVCPATCESACTLSINDSPVTIRQIERAVADEAFKQGIVHPQPARRKTGRRVSVIGSGPAGLAAAQQLARLGHDVMVIEKAPEPGGILRYGIPNFKLEKQIIDRRIDQMRQEGVRFETSVAAGEDISAQYLRKTCDALLIACGAEAPRDLPVPGRELDGIHFAMDYLSHASRCASAGTKPDPRLSAEGKNVLVIGGGDTGADCVGTANRQGAHNILQFEILEKPREWSEPWNPEWPSWPKILRTSSSHEEGCVREWSVTTKRFEGVNGRVTKAHCARVAWSMVNDRMHMEEVPGSEFTVAVDLVLLAMGFTGIATNRLIQDLHLSLKPGGTLAVDSFFMTSVPGLFAAGDAVLGPSLVVRCIAQGREAAQAIHHYLMQQR